MERGPSYGYFANSIKTWLIVKPSVEASAKEIFKDTGINITSEGRPYLGSPLGLQSYVEDFVNQKVTTYQSSVLTLTNLASSQPHVAFAAFTCSLSSQWLYLCCTTPNICFLLEPLEETIRTKFIPVLTGRTPLGVIE